MPLNPQSIRKRSELERRVHMDSRHRILLPPGMGWKMGDRVYLTLFRSNSDEDEPTEFVVTTRPKALLNGRLVSGRIQRAGFARIARVRNKPRRSWP